MEDLLNNNILIDFKNAIQLGLSYDWKLKVKVARHHTNYLQMTSSFLEFLIFVDCINP